MRRWLSYFQPVLPGYSGGFPVGARDYDFDVEPHEFGTVCTAKSVCFRVYYPAEAENDERFTWIPQPQRAVLSAYLSLLGLGRMGSFLSYFPRVLYNITIPASVNAQVRQQGRPFPVVVFSHGLLGSRGAYSQICGELASHGMIVVAAEHRDHTAVYTSDRGQPVDYFSIRKYNDASRDLRKHQLEQRAFEVERIIAEVRARPELAEVRAAGDFEAGKLIMAGHSFGAATAIAICKSAFPSPSAPHLAAEFRAIVLLDTWTEPLTASMDLPLKVPSITILSEKFFAWSTNLNFVRKIVGGEEGATKGDCFYIKGSAHPSQSDFPLLFPVLTGRLFGIEESAQRCMDLNRRAMVQFLREHGVAVPGTDSEVWREKGLARVDIEDGVLQAE